MPQCLQTKCGSNLRVETNHLGHVALTPPGAPGLPVARLVCEGRSAYRDLHMADSALVLHESSGAEMDVRRGAFSWRFVTASGLFDYYPAGLYEQLTRTQARSSVLAVTIPASFERLVSEHGRRAVPLSPRFQFQDRRLARLVLALLQSATVSSGADPAALSLALTDRLHDLMMPARPSEDVVEFSPLMRRLVEEHIDRHLGVAMDVDALVPLSGLPRAQVSRAFRATFGKSLHDFVVERRISVAKQELLRRTASLTDLAHRLGFASHAHFSTVFKNRVGVTPSQFRGGSLSACGEGTS